MGFSGPFTCHCPVERNTSGNWAKPMSVCPVQDWERRWHVRGRTLILISLPHCRTGTWVCLYTWQNISTWATSLSPQRSPYMCIVLIFPFSRWKTMLQ
jgi:hypothetical protein